MTPTMRARLVSPLVVPIRFGRLGLMACIAPRALH